MPNLDELISRYLRAITVEGKSPKTVVSYANSLADFRAVGRIVGLPDRLEEYRVDHVYEYLAELQRRGKSPIFRQRRQREVKACFGWFRRVGLIESNVFSRVPLVKVPEKLKHPFTPEEVHALLGGQDRSTRTGARNAALILFLLDTGVRASECIGIELSDIDWARERVLVRHGKGEKERWVGLGDRAREAVTHYLRFRGADPGALFLTSRGGAMTSPGTLEIIFRRQARRVGVALANPHKFRHTFATWAIEAGAREIDVQMLLGHADLTMTHRYARTYTSEQAIRIHSTISPANRLFR